MNQPLNHKLKTLLWNSSPKINYEIWAIFKPGDYSSISIRKIAFYFQSIFYLNYNNPCRNAELGLGLVWQPGLLSAPGQVYKPGSAFHYGTSARPGNFYTESDFYVILKIWFSTSFFTLRGYTSGFIFLLLQRWTSFYDKRLAR